MKKQKTNKTKTKKKKKFVELTKHQRSETVYHESTGIFFLDKIQTGKPCSKLPVILAKKITPGFIPFKKNKIDTGLQKTGNYRYSRLKLQKKFLFPF